MGSEKNDCFLVELVVKKTALLSMIELIEQISKKLNLYELVTFINWAVQHEL